MIVWLVGCLVVGCVCVLDCVFWLLLYDADDAATEATDDVAVVVVVGDVN